jgi:hypothetical protein
MIRQLTTAGLFMMLSAGCASDHETPQSDPLQIESCAGQPGDPYSLGKLSVEGNVLTAPVQHGGGCASHSYAVCWDGAMVDTFPGMVALALSHDAHGDSCDALLLRDLHIDLAPVIEAAGVPVQIEVTGATGQLAGTTNVVTLGE